MTGNICPYAFHEGKPLCKLYRKDAFVCNQDDKVELLFCGAFKMFFAVEEVAKMNEMIGSLAFLSKEELSGA